MKTTEETNAEIAANLHEKVKLADFSQKDLAEMMNISEKHLSMVLNCKVPMTIQMHKRIEFYIKKLEQ